VKFLDRFYDSILDGSKVLTRRPVKGPNEDPLVGIYRRETVTFHPSLRELNVRYTGISQGVLADVDDDEAHLEGFPDARAFCDFWDSIYHDGAHLDRVVWRIRFEVVL